MKGATMNNNTKYNLNFFSMDDSFHTKIQKISGKDE